MTVCWRKRQREVRYSDEYICYKKERNRPKKQKKKQKKKPTKNNNNNKTKQNKTKSKQTNKEFNFTSQRSKVLVFSNLKWLRRPPRERKIPSSNPACDGIFFGVESYQ